MQESLGFSPFELVFGDTVRGPLKLLKEKLISSSSEYINLLQYVSDFRTKLFRACELARANLSSSQKCIKEKYYVDAVEYNFKPGQKVLTLLPVPGKPLNTRFFGPYVIQKKLSDLNYVVVTPDSRKQSQLGHVNMLKPYVERSSDPVLTPVNVNASKEISAFVTPHGLYQYKVMPFGTKNSLASLQHLINKVIADLEACEAYKADVI